MAGSWGKSTTLHKISTRAFLGWLTGWLILLRNHCCIGLRSYSCRDVICRFDVTLSNPLSEETEWRNTQHFSSATQIHLQCYFNCNYDRWVAASQSAELLLRLDGLSERKWGPFWFFILDNEVAKLPLHKHTLLPPCFTSRKKKNVVTFDMSIYSCVLTASTYSMYVSAQGREDLSS